MTREEVEKALGPVWDWYQSEEEPERPLEDILRDISWDLRKDRQYVLSFRGGLSLIMLHIQKNTVTSEEMETFCRDMWEIGKPCGTFDELIEQVAERAVTEIEAEEDGRILCELESSLAAKKS